MNRGGLAGVTARRNRDNARGRCHRLNKGRRGFDDQRKELKAYRQLSRRRFGDWTHVPRCHGAVDTEHLRSYGGDFGERMAAAGFRVRVIAAGDLAGRDEQARFGILGAAAGVVHFGTKP